MRIYLAARYSRREELCEYANILRKRGHEITARWIDGKHELRAARIITNTVPMEARPFAQEDFDDVYAADCLIHFSQSADTPQRRGGNLVELGMALAWGKRIILFGPRQNVFHTLPQVEEYDNFEAVVDSLVMDS